MASKEREYGESSTSGEAVLLNDFEIANIFFEANQCSRCARMSVYKCPGSHLWCFDCHIKFKAICPRCRLGMGSVNCLNVPRMTEPLEAFQNMYHCPYRMGCKVVEKVPSLVEHLNIAHGVELIDASAGISYPYVFPDLDSEVTWTLKVVNCDEHQLCTHFKGSFLVGGNPSFLESLDQDIDRNNFLVPCFVAFAQYMGLEADAAKMKYSFEIGGAERRIMWQGVPSSIRKTPAKICEQLDAFVVPRKLFLSFLDENHALHVNSRFWLEETIYGEDASIETFIFRGQDRYFPIESPELLISSIFLNEIYPSEGEMSGHTYKCPYPGARCCGSKETVKDVVTHLANVHEVRVSKESSFERVYVYSKPNEFDQGSWLLEVFSCHGRSFALQFQAMNIGVVPFYMLFLRILGERSEAEKFSCSLKIVGQGRKLEWVGKPRDLRESEESIRDGLEGVVLPKSQAFLMCQANPVELRLRVEGKIERVQGGLFSLLGFKM